MYDAIVVGARCAGSPTAMLLARQGYRVLEDYTQWVIETRNAFPDLHLTSAWFLSQGSLDSTLPWQVVAEKGRPASFSEWMEPSTFKRLRFISVVQGYTHQARM
jgi:choline dehydrogenase-like flavoprotein